MTLPDIPRRSMLRGAAVGGAALLAGGRLATAGAASTKRPATEKLATETLAGHQPGPVSQRFPNVQVSHDGFAAHAETCLAVNPCDKRNLLGACIVTAPDGAGAIAAYASFDGGNTWLNAGALPGSGNGRDPSVTFDAHGRGYICANTDDVHVWRTSDGGRTFAQPALATRGTKLDHPWLAADPGRPGGGLLYGAWTTGAGNSELGFTRSTDAGATFEDQRVIAVVSGKNEANFASPMVAAGPAGSVYVIYGVWPPVTPVSSGPRPEVAAIIRVSRSADHGQSWAPPGDLGNGIMEIRVTPAVNGIGTPSIVASRRGNFAAAAFITRAPGSPVTNVAVCVSHDRGRTWSAPATVSSGNEDTIFFQPQLAVDDADRLALTAFAYQQGRADVLLFTAPPQSARFSRPIRVSTQSFDPGLGLPGGKHGAWWIGDYQGLAFGGSRVHPFWNDTRTGHLEIFTAAIPPAIET